MRNLAQLPIRFAGALALALASPLTRAATADTAPLADAMPLSQETVSSAMAASIAEHYSLEGDVRVEFLRAWTAPDKVARKWAFEVSDLPMMPSSSMLVHLKVLADGAVASEGPVTVRVELMRDVWVVRQPLTSGAPFEKTELDVRRVDGLKERDAVPASVGDNSYVYTRAVQAGHYLTWHDLGRRPLVRKGDLVDVTASEGALSISMKALAMQSGAQGDAVTIRNIESHKDFTAIVVDENHVQIHF